ncbi:MAG TPA: toxin glutamine deamidase domain-containing protein [Mycobacteriales bacterium]|nr:toxin glutamine deamidase domain-containing protein [Mycobacteriales bacterium]
MTSLNDAMSGTDLIPGNPGAVEDLAASLGRFAVGMGDAAGVLSGIETGSWVGDGAASFRKALDEQPARFGAGGQAFGSAAVALYRYAGRLRSAQSLAERAVERYTAGQVASAPWLASRAEAPLTPDARHSVLPPELRRPETDPGEADRIAAGHILRTAQEEIEAAAKDILPVLEKSRRGAPRRPSLWQRIGDGLASRIEHGPGGPAKVHLENFLIGMGRAGHDLGTGTWSMTGGFVTDPHLAAESWLNLARLVSGDNAAARAFALNFVDFQDWQNNPAQAAGYAATNLGALLVSPGKLVKSSHAPPDLAALDEAVRKVNPNFKTRDPAYTLNCVHCAQALPLRLRGRDATARPLPQQMVQSGGRGALVITGPWRADLVHAGRAEISHAVQEAGPGSVAAILVYWRKGGGHAFNAVNISGRVHFVDAQAHLTDVSSYFDRAVPGQTSYVMLPSSEPSRQVTRYVWNARPPIHPTTVVTRSASLAVTAAQPSAR